jgi:hypothetical protein
MDLASRATISTFSGSARIADSEPGRFGQKHPIGVLDFFKLGLA